MESYIGLAAAPLIWSLIQYAIKPWNCEPRTYPAIAVLMGVILNVAIALNLSTDLLTAVLVGVTTGLAAIGLNSGATHTLAPKDTTN